MMKFWRKVMKRDKEMFEEMVEFYGSDKIPNPDHYPKQFEFLTRSFEYYKKTQNKEIQKI